MNEIRTRDSQSNSQLKHCSKHANSIGHLGSFDVENTDVTVITAFFGKTGKV